jgi:hypothetical protein
LGKGSDESRTRVMELTSQLFQTSLTAWVADPNLGFMVGPDISEGTISGTRYADTDISKTLTNFLGQALVEPKRKGAYRDELLAFVTGTFFDTFNPEGSIAKALIANGSVGADGAGQFGGNLLGILSNAQVDIYQGIAQASDDKKRLYTLLWVTGVSAAGGLLGSAVGGPGAAVLLTKAAIAALTEMAKTGGRFTIDDLQRRGVDAATAKIIFDFVNFKGTAAQAFESSGLAKQFEGAGLTGADFETARQRLEGSLTSGNTFGRSIADLAHIIDNLLSNEVDKAAVEKWLAQVDEGIAAQTRG